MDIILACSGPGAGRVIQESILIGYFCAGLAGLVTFAAICLQRFWGGPVWPFLVCAALLALHPAWSISAIHGDCGYFKREASYAVSLLFGALLAFQLLAARSAQRSQRVMSNES
jgi:hypothetical protein